MQEAAPLRERVPLTRATGYPHDNEPDAPTVDLACTHMGVGYDHLEVGQVTVFADTGDPTQPYGFEFDLEPEDARELAASLMEAAANAAAALEHEQ